MADQLHRIRHTQVAAVHRQVIPGQVGPLALGVEAVEPGALPVLPERLPPRLSGGQAILRDDALNPVVHITVDKHTDEPLRAGEHMVRAEAHDDAGALRRRGPDGLQALLGIRLLKMQVGIEAANPQPLGQPPADLFAAAAVLPPDCDDHTIPSPAFFLTGTVYHRNLNIR